MTLPVRRQRTSGLAERRLPGWTRDPLAEFDDLFDRMGSLLESTVGGLAPTGIAWTPLADITETDDAYVIEVELPGVRREDVNVEISGQELMITGEMKERERQGVLRRSTRRTGRFEYRAILPGDINPEGVTAAMQEGVLTVTVPKAETAKPRHIEITAGD